MRVLHINCNYMTTVLHQTMVEHLDKTGVESHVFAPVYDASRAVIQPNGNVTVAECFRKWDRLHFDYKQKKIMAGLENRIDASGFDCIHAYTLFTDGNCAMKLSEKYHIPYVVAVRSTDMNSFFRLKPWLRGRGIQIMERASAVFFLSQRYMEDMLNNYVPESKRDAIRSKSSVVPNGIDDFWLSNVPAPRSAEQLARIREKKVDIIVAGRVNRNKNQVTLMKAVEKLNTLGYQARLLVVGSVEDESVLRQLKNSSVVTYESAKPKDQLIELYRKSDIFVLPSYQETFGLVYAEAMSQGLPVLYTRGQGFDGQFPEGTVGYHVEADSADDIVRKILDVCENYAALSENGPRLAKQFTWDGIVKGYQDIYHNIAKI